MNTISVVISAYNEERKLGRLLASVQWADEIIVIDNESTDHTVAIAKEYSVKVITRANNPMLNINKNFGFEHASKDWILNLDGDEEVTESLAKEIQSVLHQNTDIQGYWIPRKNIIFGKWIQHGLWWPDKQLRLFKRGKGKFPGQHVHEYLAVEGKTDSLSEPFVHYNYESISQYLAKVLTIYTDNEVINRQQKGYKVVWYDALRMPLSDFVKIFFAQQGYKDGLHGLVLALLQSFYALIVFAKLWEKEQFPDYSFSLHDVEAELAKGRKEIQYWEKTSELSQSHHPVHKMIIKLKRKYVTTR